MYMTERKRLRVALLFGGKSTEHEVSLTSTVGILKNINQDKYYILPVKITKRGRWMLLSDPTSLDSVESLSRAEGVPVVIGDPEAKGLFRIRKSSDRSPSDVFSYIPVDVAFPILHGTFGEDGTIQGLLSTADLPFVGAGVLASALGMDKIMMKQIFFQNELPSADFMWFLRKDWKTSAEVIQNGVKEQIGFPCFIKPANSGSSVGVFKAHNEKEFPDFVNRAAEYDRKILVEKSIDARELECSVLGNDKPEASVVGEIIAGKEFYDYEAKYQSEESRSVIPADIPEKISNAVRQLAVKAFKAVDCSGMGRVDFLLEHGSNHIFINEINTIPGFTPISMYPKLWEASGISYSELIDRLIELALERYEDLSRSRFRRE
jgi:D-alanine-D-alanine ligase